MISRLTNASYSSIRKRRWKVICVLSTSPGEDYLYPEEYVVLVDVPRAAPSHQSKRSRNAVTALLNAPGWSMFEACPALRITLFVAPGILVAM